MDTRQLTSLTSLTFNTSPGSGVQAYSSGLLFRDPHLKVVHSTINTQKQLVHVLDLASHLVNRFALIANLDLYGCRQPGPSDHRHQKPPCHAKRNLRGR